MIFIFSEGDKSEPKSIISPFSSSNCAIKIEKLYLSSKFICDILFWKYNLLISASPKFGYGSSFSSSFMRCIIRGLFEYSVIFISSRMRLISYCGALLFIAPSSRACISSVVRSKNRVPRLTTDPV